MADGALAGRVALITGGSRGIGEAIAHAYADEGADVAIVGRDKQALEETAEGIISRGRQAHVAVTDLRDISVLPELFDQAESALGEITILVANAGVQDVSPALEVTEEAFDEQSDINLKSLFFTNQEAGRRMIERGNGGNIVNLGSTFSVVGFENFSVYCATKAGVHLLTKSLAIEWAKHRVNVNAIGPTATLTEMNKPLFADEEFAAGFMPTVPAGRLPDPSDIARAAVFLAGPDADMVHGHLLLVDCGFTAH
jgi:NAD(P)-dependent dehydrogenase (short-subunit alcohol dehydrogenase family)